MPHLVPLSPAPCRGNPPPLVRDPEMQRLYREAEDLAAGRIPVLLVGETGVGKELLAEAIHHASTRSAHPLVRINCAAVAHTLFESELFGHERGAFTGGEREKPGLLEAAGAGTVLLDEVGELPLLLQAKLLRAVEAGLAHRVGGLVPRPVHARFVSATNRDLHAAMERGEFRRDLYYRLAGAVLTVPPLRARRHEILPLAESFASSAARELGRPPVELTCEARTRLLENPWPGNVRELRNVIERAVLLARDGLIGPEHLPGTPLQPGRPPAAAAVVTEAPAANRRTMVLEALAGSGGNQKQAAQRLGINRRTLARWLDQLAIARPRSGLPVIG
jgi:transcriptional regulator with PAS, ATPase and Fis domain